MSLIFLSAHRRNRFSGVESSSLVTSRGIHRVRVCINRVAVRQRLAHCGMRAQSDDGQFGRRRVLSRHFGRASRRLLRSSSVCCVRCFSRCLPTIIVAAFFVLRCRFIDRTRQLVDTKLTALVGESYNRYEAVVVEVVARWSECHRSAYTVMVRVQQLSELEEVKNRRCSLSLSACGLKA
jgi:hypothetical protein